MHTAWLQDLSIRLLCVLALDRFADFVGDSVVVPVRESCSQTLGVVASLCDAGVCRLIMFNGLLKLIDGCGDENNNDKSRWEVRHAGLIGLKYFLAVRKDLGKTNIIFTLMRKI